jgi:very-short-patch-repair endonuclease
VYRSTLIAPFLQQTALGAVLWAGDAAVASHFTAARLYGSEVPHANPHIWVPPERSPKSPRVVVHRGEIARNDRRIRDRVPVTSPARTLVDLAGMLDEESFEAVVEDFFHRGVTTPLAVQRCLDGSGGTGRPGSRLLRALLADRDEAPLERKLEVKLWRLLRKAGLRPVRQFEVRCGQNTYRLDFAWPILKVAVEGEGFAAHGGRLAHVRDNRRLAELVAVGWRVVPVTWEECTQAPAAVIDTVRRALLQAA